MADEKIQTSNGQIARQCNRIIYIEPNDVYDRDCGNKQVGETLTPKYEDFCISFNLIMVKAVVIYCHFCILINCIVMGNIWC